MEANPYVMALGVILFTATGVYIIVSRKKIRRRAVRYYLKSPKFLKPFLLPRIPSLEEALLRQSHFLRDSELPDGGRAVLGTLQRFPLKNLSALKQLNLVPIRIGHHGPLSPR